MEDFLPLSLRVGAVFMVYARCVLPLNQLLPKGGRRAYTPCLTCPLLEVRQAEIEAGDCEGRLPLLFLTPTKPIHRLHRFRRLKSRRESGYDRVEINKVD